MKNPLRLLSTILIVTSSQIFACDCAKDDKACSADMSCCKDATPKQQKEEGTAKKPEEKSATEKKDTEKPRDEKKT